MIEQCLRRVQPRYRAEYSGIAAVVLCEIAQRRQFPDNEEFRRYAARSIVNQIIKEQVKNQAKKRSAVVLSFNDDSVQCEIDGASYKEYQESLVSESKLQELYTKLTPRQKRILSAVSNGFTYEEISRYEKLSRSRVKQIVQEIKKEYRR